MLDHWIDADGVLLAVNGPVQPLEETLFTEEDADLACLWLENNRFDGYILNRDDRDGTFQLSGSNQQSFAKNK